MVQFIHMFPSEVCHTVPRYKKEGEIMLELLVIILFCWFFFKAAGLAFKVA